MTDSERDNWDKVRFRPRRVGGGTAPDDAWVRFVWGAILFIAVALAYPWYSYWVNSRLAEVEARRALQSIDSELKKMETQAAPSLVPAPKISRRAASPRILGVSEGTNSAVILANLDGGSVVDLQPQLCALAAGWTRRPVTGRVFRVQRYRGEAPALSVGEIQC